MNIVDVLRKENINKVFIDETNNKWKVFKEFGGDVVLIDYNNNCPGLEIDEEFRISDIVKMRFRESGE